MDQTFFTVQAQELVAAAAALLREEEDLLPLEEKDFFFKKEKLFNFFFCKKKTVLVMFRTCSGSRKCVPSGVLGCLVCVYWFHRWYLGSENSKDKKYKN